MKIFKFKKVNRGSKIERGDAEEYLEAEDRKIHCSMRKATVELDDDRDLQANMQTSRTGIESERNKQRPKTDKRNRDGHNSDRVQARHERYKPTENFLEFLREYNYIGHEYKNQKGKNEGRLANNRTSGNSMEYRRVANREADDPCRTEHGTSPLRDCQTSTPGLETEPLGRIRQRHEMATSAETSIHRLYIDRLHRPPRPYYFKREEEESEFKGIKLSSNLGSGWTGRELQETGELGRTYQKSIETLRISLFEPCLAKDIWERIVQRRSEAKDDFGLDGSRIGRGHDEIHRNPDERNDNRNEKILFISAKNVPSDPNPEDFRVRNKYFDSKRLAKTYRNGMVDYSFLIKYSEFLKDFEKVIVR